MNIFLSALRRIQTWFLVVGKSSFLSCGRDLHIGRGVRLWAPKRLKIGDYVYIGRDVHIESNCEIGDFCLLANRVSIIGRHDHDFSAIGFPMRFSPWIGSLRLPSPYIDEKAVIESDVWLGYGVIVLTGVIIGRGSVVAAGSVVTEDIPSYSIVGGVPARVIGRRFADDAAIAMHESAMVNGKYHFSERGYDHCIIEPALNGSSHKQ